MSSLPTPLEIMNRFYEAETIYMAAAPADRNFADGMGRTLSTDLKLVQSPDLPWGGNYHGHEGFQKWSETMASYFSSLEMAEGKVFQNPDADDLLILGEFRVTLKNSGEKWVAPMVQKVKVNREEGVIVEIQPFYWDVAGLNKALGR